MKVEPKSLKYIVYGVKYNANFRLYDNMGRILDKIVFDKDSPFSPEYFPEWEDINHQEMVLNNKNNGCYLKLSTTSIVFRHFVSDNTRFETEIKWIRENVVPFLNDEIFERYKINKIFHVGLMVENILHDKERISKVFSNEFFSNYEKLDKVSLQRTKIFKDAFGIGKTHESDFGRVTAILKQTAPEQFNYALDFQFISDKNINELPRWDYSTFFIKATKFIQDTLY